MRKIFFVLGFLLAVQGSQAQKLTDKEYATSPHWITMMDDPKVNYFEALHAYEVYWQNNEKPAGEGDMNIKEKTKNKKRFSKKEQKEAREEAAMAFQIKKFDWWRNRVEPYVQEDGSIINPQEKTNQR